MEISNPDFVIPAAIIIGCIMLALVTNRLTRTKPKSISVPQMAPQQVATHQRAPAQAAPPVVPQQTPAQVGTQQLGLWHRSYGGAIQAWIQNHEALLDEITDGGLDVQAVSPELTARHEQLAPIIKDAIEGHPAPEMRAQLSAMIVASQATLHALHRHQYENAERQHLAYLDYRDPWLHRLRQFSTTDADANEIRSLAHQHRETPGWQQA